MTNTPDLGKERSRARSEASSTSDQAEPPQPVTKTPHIQDGPEDCEPSALIDEVHNTEPSPRQDSDVWDTTSSGLMDEEFPCFDPENQDDEIAIAAIRATDMTLGLRRLPSGFFVVLRHRDLKWRTELKPSSVNEDIVDWHGPIPISSDASATICVEVYASFELQPMLGSGEQLRKMTVTVKELLDCSESNSPFKFSPKEGDVVSPCTSVSVSVKRQKPVNASPSMSKILGRHWSTPGSQSELEDVTNRGHNTLSRYRRGGARQDLQHSIREFEHALNICPRDHPYRPVAQSNLAMAELIRFRVEGGNDRLEVALQMYRDALAVRPLDHPDRPTTLLHMAMVHFAQCRNQTDDRDQQAQGLLNEVLGDGARESHAKQAARALQNLFARRNMDPMQPHQQTSVGRDEASGAVREDPWVLHVQLLERFEQFGYLADIEQAISILQQLIKSTSIWDSRYPEALQNLGVALQERFGLVGKMADLEDAISMLRNAVNLIPHGHPNKPGCLNNLGNSLRTRFLHVGELSDIEDAISVLRNAVDLTPLGHPRKPNHLNNLCNSFLSRFQCVGELSDLEGAISALRDAVNLTPLGHPDKPMHLNSLGNSLRTRFETLGEFSDLEDAIPVLRDAVALTPLDHPHKPRCLSNLGSSFLTRFQRVGGLGNLEDAITALRDAVDLTPLGHPNRPMYLNILGNCLRTRFQHVGEPSGIEDAISALRDAVGLTPLGHPNKPMYLNNLGSSLLARFEHVGELSDLEDAISVSRDAVDLTPLGHSNKPAYLNNLGNSFLIRFQCVGEPSDLEDGISVLRNAVDLTPLGHPGKPRRLNNLGNSFLTRFERVGELSDLEDAISALRDAVGLTPLGHPDKPMYLNNLGNSLRTRFESVGELSDLEDAISASKDAVGLTPLGHTNKPRCLNNLGNSLITRFERLGELGDLEDAISALRDAVDLIPPGHPDKPSCLSNLGNSFLNRFEQAGELSDLEDAISALRDAVDLTPLGHPDKPRCLSNLGTSLKARFEHVGGLSDLEDAISALRDAVGLTALGHPNKPMYLSNLGNSLRTRFERVGEPGDLEDAISALRDAVDLTPLGHPDKPRCLSSLGSSLRTRFDRIGELSDLEDAISALRDAVDLTPLDHPDNPRRLNNLGTSLRTCFQHVGELGHLEDAISALRNAVDLTPLDHPDKPSRLSNLGSTFLTRFQRVGELSDLGDAISAFMDAIDLTPLGHPDKPMYLNNLGASLRTRFERVGELNDLEDGISTLRNAVDLTPLGHPDRPRCLSNLGASLLTRYERIGELGSLEGAISLFSHAVSFPIGPVIPRFHASRQWISCARQFRHPSLLHAYSLALHLIPELAWVGSSLIRRYRQLALAADIVRDAAAAALDAGFPRVAVEWLEQGRSIVWGELLQLRSPYEELSSVHPEYARKLRKLSTELDQASADREISSVQTPAGTLRMIEPSHQVADTQRRLAIQRDKLLQEIRRFPGFEQFLRHKRFSQLRASAHSGPVVILNAAESRCDALVVLADLDHVIHVPLTKFTYVQLSGLQTSMKEFAREARVGTTVKRPQVQFSWETMLSFLWTNVVKLVLDALAFSEPGELSRIFWCPTGPFAFLPIHAAGLYGIKHSQPGQKLLDSHISSYIPALSILAPLSNPRTAPIKHLCLLAVRQPVSDGLRSLPGVDLELKHIETVIEKSPKSQTVFVESLEGTVEEVLRLMKDADWVHFACHGVQDPANAINSGLCLADNRRLALRDIIGLQRPRGGLAFLSACDTAKGDQRLSDEAAHIAAGMLFAGYGGVVGTMWTISDQLAPEVAKDVYEYLFRDGSQPDYGEAAQALHEAIGRARHAGASFSKWVPFIHLGL